MATQTLARRALFVLLPIFLVATVVMLGTGRAFAGATDADKPLIEQLQELRERFARLEATLAAQAKSTPAPAGMAPAAGMPMAGGGMEGKEMMGMMDMMQMMMKKMMGMESKAGMAAMGSGTDPMKDKGAADGGMGSMASMEGKEMMGMMDMMQMMMKKMMGMESKDGMGAMGAGAAPMKGMGAGGGGMGAMASMEGEDSEMGMAPQPSMTGGAVRSSLPGFPGASHLYHIGATGFFLDHPKHLTLTTEQQKALNSAKEKALLEKSTFVRKTEEAEQALWTLTASDSPDAAQIAAKVREIESLRAEQRLAFIGAVGEAAKVLTDEQRQTLAGDQAAAAAKPDAKDPHAAH